MISNKKLQYIKTIFIIAGLLLLFSCGPGQYNLNTSVIPEGAGTITPAGGRYDAGSEINIIARASPGYRFDHWSGDSSGEANTARIFLNSDKTVVALFIAQYTLSTSVIPENTGRITPAGGIYDTGSEIILNAEPLQGYRFDYWSGDITGNKSSTTIHERVESNKTIIAHFVPRYEPQEIDELIAQLGSSEEELRLQASSELGELGSIINEQQIGRILDIMRKGENAWITSTWSDGDATWYETTTIQYYAAIAIINMKSPYVTAQVVAEAEGIQSSAKSTRQVVDSECG